jgi:hypothetical protein
MYLNPLKIWRTIAKNPLDVPHCQRAILGLKVWLTGISAVVGIAGIVIKIVH